MTNDDPRIAHGKVPGRRPGARLAAAIALACAAVVPGIASAQSTLAGTVTDRSGAVLPGVTVEASSPALIEKVRTAVTGLQGRYTIVDLRPGVYTVTFTLTGFTTVRQQDIALPAAFTATVNAEMPVGTLEEVVTVAGGTPTVDVRNTAKQTTLSKELLEAVPSGGTAQYYATLMLGVSQEALSFRAPANSYRWSDLTFRGSRESSVQMEGFDTSHRLSGDGSQMVLNAGMTQEVVVSRGAGGADQQAGGLVTNVILKSGGNRFSGSFNVHFANEDFVGENLSSEMIAAGVGGGELRKTWDVNPAGGGPILQEKLWFFGSYRNFGNKVSSGAYRDLNPLDWVYTPDTSRPTDSEQLRNQNYSLRVTWQATPRNNVSFFGDINPTQGTTAAGSSPARASTWRPRPRCPGSTIRSTSLASPGSRRRAAVSILKAGW
jgi:Carboxypeptidase regulatory-like domain